MSFGCILPTTILSTDYATFLSYNFQHSYANIVVKYNSIVLAIKNVFFNIVHCCIVEIGSVDLFVLCLLWVLILIWFKFLRIWSRRTWSQFPFLLSDSQFWVNLFLTVFRLSNIALNILTSLWFSSLIPRTFWHQPNVSVENF